MRGQKCSSLNHAVEVGAKLPSIVDRRVGSLQQQATDPLPETAAAAASLAGMRRALGKLQQLWNSGKDKGPEEQG